MILSYRTVKTIAEAELIEKKSRFIATVAPVSTEEEALCFAADIRKKYKDATHNCMAYRVGLNTLYERRSDDGEPSGTAGAPMLEVLRKENVTNVAAIVTRYFGGILLGGGGLVRAYSASCAAGLRTAEVIEKKLMSNVRMTVDYGLAGKFQYEIAGRELILYDTVYDKDVTFCMWIPVEVCDWTEEFFTTLAAGKLTIVKKEADYV